MHEVKDMNKLSQVDQNFEIPAYVEKTDLCYYDVKTAPFAVYGVFYEDGYFRRIPETVAKAVQKDGKDCMFPLPEHFHVEINFREHFRAYDGGFYPGATQVDEKTVAYDSDDWLDCLKFFHWVL